MNMLHELDGGHLLFLHVLLPQAEHAVNGRLEHLRFPVALFRSVLVRLRDARFLGAWVGAWQVAYHGAPVGA